LKWIQKYVAIMRDYVDAMKPELSRVFHADETKVSIRGQWVWLWHLMDGDTRFLLANHVSQGRNVADAQFAFREAKATAKVELRALLTDGLVSYGPAARREFSDAVHVSGVGLQGRLNNNRMERYHGTFKERNKVMRNLKNTDTPILDGQRIYYNHIRPHQVLNGKTPAQAAGLELDLGPNKWESLIKQAKANETPLKLTRRNPELNPLSNLPEPHSPLPMGRGAKRLSAVKTMVHGTVYGTWKGVMEMLQSDIGLF
jgi:transposase-like protein